MPELILASTSPARRALLGALGLPFRVEASGVDETVPEGMAAAQAVALLAERKAQAVWRAHPEAWVLGSDQLVWFEGTRLGKPADREQAKVQLTRLAGTTHELVTGVCLLGPSFREVAVETTRMTLYPLEAGELERYLDLGEWEGCAGAYRVEGAGGALMAGIEGDRTNVQGLPMLQVVAMLRKAGFTFFGR